MRPSPFDGSAMEYLLMQDITLSTLTISTVYAIIRVSMSARWELCTDTQQPDRVKKAKSATDLKFLFYLFLWKVFPKATDWQLGIFTCKVAKKSVGKKTNHESNLYKWHICFLKNPPHFHTVCPTRPAAQLPSDHHPSCLKPCKTASLLNAGKKYLFFSIRHISSNFESLALSEWL